MAHTLLHQILVSDLVVPIAMAQAPGQETLPRFGARLASDTWLRGDVIVAERVRVPPDGWYVDGPPLLVVEVTSEASAHRDLGPKKDLWARFGVPSLWIVQPGGRGLGLHVFELDGEQYAERARVSGNTPYRVKRPFEMELVPNEIFGRQAGRPVGQAARAGDQRRRGTGKRRKNMTEHTGTDLPSPEEKILIDTFAYRWPTGAEKAELWDGCPVFYGVWDERDVEIARRAYPGRVIRLDQEPGSPGTLCVLPADDATHAVAADDRSAVSAATHEAGPGA